MPYDYTFNEVENAFISWLVEIGLPPANTARLKLDGEKHRYRSAREKRVTQEPVEYKVYMDESPAGYVQDYKTGAYYSWSYHRKNEKPWTEDEKRAYLRKREERKEESEREAAIARARAIADAGKKWEMATPVDPKALHPYLKKKRLSRAYGARILGRNLIIPLYNKEGEIVSVQ